MDELITAYRYYRLSKNDKPTKARWSITKPKPNGVIIVQKIWLYPDDFEYIYNLRVKEALNNT